MKEQTGYGFVFSTVALDVFLVFLTFPDYPGIKLLSAFNSSMPAYCWFRPHIGAA